MRQSIHMELFFCSPIFLTVINLSGAHLQGAYVYILIHSILSPNCIVLQKLVYFLKQTAERRAQGTGQEKNTTEIWP